MRLIDADALNLDYEVEMADDWKTAHEMANLVKYAPTVEAEPVVHGEWEDDPYVWKCNKCHSWYEVTQFYGDMNYCPNCGAKMDGVCDMTNVYEVKVFQNTFEMERFLNEHSEEIEQVIPSITEHYILLIIKKNKAGVSDDSTRSNNGH